ncbi:MAG: uracil-DNA glycosylase [Candidatus Saccharimonas sp.]
MNLEKQLQLDRLAKQIIDDEVCSELRGQATQLVVGKGNLNADIVLIGEAPGKQEDLTGEPFVGASGKFLDTMLEAAGIDRSDIYITNIVKYRPPDNRDPSKEEKQAFWPYLLQQLEIIKPKVVVTLGRHSLECFLPGTKISQIHGQIVRPNLQVGSDQRHQWTIIPLYHPAAALYDGRMRQTLVDDFIVIPEILKDLG